MIEGGLSRRYTRALFELAKESGQEEAIGDEIERFLAVYTGSPLPTVLNNPAIELESRRKTLLTIVSSMRLSPVSQHFLSLLLERDRLSYLPSIVSRYRGVLNEVRGRVEARVAAASPLEPVVLEHLSTALRRISHKEVVLHEETDSGLIGGLVVEFEGKVYDGSVRTQLEKMKQRVARQH